MAMHLSNFRIQELHGNRTIELIIRDNKLVLVGDNGSGKTTIINILYYFLSRQWSRLTTYHFGTLIATIDGEEIKLSKEHLTAIVTDKRLPPSIRRKLIRLNYTARQELIENPAKLFALGVDLDIHPQLLLDFLHSFPHDDFRFLDTNKRLEEINKRLEELLSEQILYLPTYRRIEQDLKTIFPKIDTSDLLRRDKYSRQHPENYIELVEFGMEDVERRITQKLNSLKDDIRSRLNTLTGSYLRDIINGQYKSVQAMDIEGLPTEAVESIIRRIGDDILPEPEKTQLREILSEIQQRKTIEDDQKVIAHFLIRLVELYRTQQQAETNVRRFIDVCNNYLTGKQLVFDNNEFRVFIELDSKDMKEEGYSSIEMKQLSSGEKQIVSLFSHLFLSDVKEFFVLLDEPELSLSVPWQKRFLPDIINTGYCNGLIAATHSPFIFDNELDPYTHSINEFWNTP